MAKALYFFCWYGIMRELQCPYAQFEMLLRDMYTSRVIFNP